MGKRLTSIPVGLSIILSNQHYNKILKGLLFLALTFVFNTHLAKANNDTDELICTANIIAALDNNCEAEISPDEVLVGTYTDYSIFVVKLEGGNSGNPAIITSPGMYTVSIVDPTGLYCWGIIDANDVIPPALTCEDVTLTCSADTDPVAGPAIPGVAAAYEPIVVETCGNLASLTYIDAITNGQCSDSFKQRIIRTWTATDGAGLIGTCVQTITVERASTADATAPSSFDGNDEPSFSCTDFPNNPGLFPDENGNLEITRTCLQNGFTLPLSVDGGTTETVNFTANDIPSIAELTEVILNVQTSGNLIYQLISPSGTTLNSFSFTDGFDGENPAGVWTLNIINNHYNTLVTELELILKVKVNLRPGGEICENLHYSFTDTPIDICEGEYKILRNWQVLDACQAGGVNFSQTLKVEDKKAPVITCQDIYIVGTDFDECLATVLVPDPTMTDDCTADENLNYSVSLASSVGTLSLLQGKYLISNLPLGNHDIMYTTSDACGNFSECTMTVEVQDLTVPSVVCESYHTISLQNITTGQVTQVAASVFDDGSTDNCGPIAGFAVRKSSEELFDSSVSFSCSDVGEVVMVELQVTDVNGNSNFCMTEVTVDDKVAPVFTCPANVNAGCGDEAPPIENDLQATQGVGTAPVYRVISVVNGFDTYTDDEIELIGYYPVVENCSASIYIREVGSLDNCGEGNFSRIWQAEDVSGNMSATCIQIANISNSDPFVIVDTNPTCTPFTFGDNPNYPQGPHSQYDDIEWPCDVTVNCLGPADGTDPSSAGRPIISEDQCDQVSVEFNDWVQTVNGSQCELILRTWKVLDLCQFQEINGVPVAGYWEYTQTININDTNDPVFAQCDALIEVEADPNTCDGSVTLIGAASDACTADENLNWSYEIDPFNDGGNDEIAGTGNDASGNYPIGTHKIKWKVEDRCGNVATCEQLFYVADNAAPNLYAITSTDVSLVSGPNSLSAELWATELDLGSFDDCNGPIELLIQNPSLGLDQIAPPASASPGTTFDHCDMPFVNIDLWARDAVGNWIYVIVQVVIENNTGIIVEPCLSSSISGEITTEANEFVENVRLALSGNTSIAMVDQVTEEDGTYVFEGLDLGNNYNVTPELNQDFLNGISTYDLILISQHILGINELDSPYKMIAADINQSGSITAFDMVELRKLLLFIHTEFQNNTSWKFVDESFLFPSANDPFNLFTFTFPESISFNDLSEAGVANFIGVKIGDVNQSAIPNQLVSGDTRTDAKDLVLKLEDQMLKRSEETTLNFTSTDFKDIAGYQFTLQFDPELLDFVDFEKGALSQMGVDNFGFQKLSEGIITTSWNGTSPLTLENDEIIFSLTFKAKQEVALSKAISLTSKYTKAEAYSGEAEIMDLSLTFGSSENISNQFRLFQNQPNPFTNQTMIAFELMEASTATLTVYDLSGRLLKTIEGDFAQGFNQVDLSRNELSGAGVLYYRLDTPNHSATKKMILID